MKSYYYYMRLRPPAYDPNDEQTEYVEQELKGRSEAILLAILLTRADLTRYADWIFEYDHDTQVASIPCGDWFVDGQYSEDALLEAVWDEP